MSAPASDVTSTPGQRRMARRRHRKVTEIVATAAELLAERGYHDTSLDDIARRLDVAKATLYHYFPNKEALVMACMEAVGSDVNQRLREVACTPGTARQRLATLIRIQLDVIVHESPQLATLFRQPLEWPERYRGRIKDLQREHYTIFRSVIHDGIANGEFSVANETVATHNLYGAMNYSPVWLRTGRKKDFSEMSNMVVESLLCLFLLPLGQTR